MNTKPRSAYTTRHIIHNDPSYCRTCTAARRARYARRTQGWALTTSNPTHCRTCMRHEQRAAAAVARTGAAAAQQGPAQSPAKKDR